MEKPKAIKADKRYLIFLISTNVLGGMKDVRHKTNSLKKAKRLLKNRIKSPDYNFDYGYIYDRVEGLVVIKKAKPINFVHSLTEDGLKNFHKINENLPFKKTTEK
jgi:hypothetical protein